MSTMILSNPSNRQGSLVYSVKMTVSTKTIMNIVMTNLIHTCVCESRCEAVKISGRQRQEMK